MKITFIGIGYVGLVTSLSLAQKNPSHQFVCYDVNKKTIISLQNGIPHFFEPQLKEALKSVKNIKFTCDKTEAFLESDVFFICVGTPLNAENNWDLTNLNTSIQNIIACRHDCSIVIKSTVSIGTSEKIQSEIFKKGYKDIQVFNMPEFLSQGTAVHDANFPNRIIIGSDKKTKKLEDLIRLFSHYKNVPILTMQTKASEMAKITANNFLAIKLSFVNEISNICRLQNVSVNDVISSLKYDERIGSKYMSPGIGYGGSCLPKDSKSLYTWSRKNNYHSRIIKAAIDINQDQKVILCKLLKENAPKSKNIAILGLSFKNGTDDIRDSSAIDVINFLLKLNYKISVFDPKAMTKTKVMFGKRLIYSKNITECIKNKDAALICCNWPEIVSYDLSLYVKNMKKAILIDGYSLFNSELIPENLKYIPLNK